MKWGGGDTGTSVWAAAATCGSTASHMLVPVRSRAAPLPPLCSRLPAPDLPQAAARLVVMMRRRVASLTSRKGDGGAAACPHPGPQPHPAPRHLLLLLPALADLACAAWLSGACCTPSSATACGLCAMSVCSLLVELCKDSMEIETGAGGTESMRRLNACVASTPALARALAAWMESEGEVSGGLGGGGVCGDAAWHTRLGSPLCLCLSAMRTQRPPPPVCVWGHLCPLLGACGGTHARVRASSPLAPVPGSRQRSLPLARSHNKHLSGGLCRTSCWRC
jgi:hypothetical protein